MIFKYIRWVRVITRIKLSNFWRSLREGKIYLKIEYERETKNPFTNKDLKTLFPNGGELAVIVDDRDDVWQASIHNLIQIFPYKFWKEEGDINDPKFFIDGPSHPPTNHAPPSSDTTSTTTSTKTEQMEGMGDENVGEKEGKKGKKEKRRMDEKAIRMEMRRRERRKPMVLLAKKG